MKYTRVALTLLALAVSVDAALTADAPKKTAKEALKPFNELIGKWRAIGTPEGTRAEKQKGIWQEGIRWEWEFKGDDCWLNVSFDKGKYFTEGTLRYQPDKDQFQFVVKTADSESLTFTGPLKEHLLTMEREDPTTKATQRMVISLLHSNRYLYHYETKAAGKTLYTRLYQVGATKEGVPFAIGTGEVGPLCVVSGGPPTTAVTFKGKTYYVCCGGCRDAFKAEPEKFIKEYEESQAKAAKERAAKFKSDK